MIIGMDSSSLIERLSKMELRGYVKRILDENKQLKDSVTSMTEGQKKGACSACCSKDERIEDLKGMCADKDTLNAELLRMCTTLTTHVHAMDEKLDDIKNESQQIGESSGERDRGLDSDGHVELTELKEAVENIKDEVLKFLEDVSGKMKEIKDEVQQCRDSSNERNVKLGKLDDSVRKINENVKELKDLEARLTLRLQNAVDNSANERPESPRDVRMTSRYNRPTTEQGDKKGKVTPTTSKKGTARTSYGDTLLSFQYSRHQLPTEKSGATSASIPNEKGRETGSSRFRSYVPEFLGDSSKTPEPTDDDKKKEEATPTTFARVMSDVPGYSWLGYSSKGADDKNVNEQSSKVCSVL